MNKILTFSEKVIASLGIDATAYYDKGRTLTIFEDLERDLLEFLSYIPDLATSTGKFAPFYNLTVKLLKL